LHRPLTHTSLSMSLMIALAASFLLLAGGIRLFERFFIFAFPRFPAGFLPPEVYGFHIEDVWLTTADNVRVNAWYLPASASQKTLLWFHGNAENIWDGLGQLTFYPRLGINVLAADYRGYGKSEGTPSETGVYSDADAAYDYLTQVRHIPPENIIIYGHSLGGAVAIDLASRRPCGGLIVQSSFTSVRDMARRLFRIPLLEYLPRSRFDSLAKIRRVRVPILIVHGTRDETVPFSMGQRLFEAAPEPKYFFAVPGAGHNDLLEVGGERLLERFKSFIG